MSLRRSLLTLLPKALLSRLTGAVTAVPLPRFLRRPMLGAFAKSYDIELADVERPLEDFRSFQDFFGRSLRDGARPIDPDENALLCPVDGRIIDAEDIDEDRMLIVKGVAHSAKELARGLPEPERFLSGQAISLYLAPRDYHRIHAPADATLLAWSHVPGSLFPVNPPAVQSIPRLFCRNERVGLLFDSERFGRFALIAVGALNVGSIRFHALPKLRSNRFFGRACREGRFDPPQQVMRGHELGAFAFGSTVILLLEQEAVARDALTPGQRVLCGQRIGKTLGS